MIPPRQPFREPLHITVLRNGIIAIGAGAVLARFWGGLARWPLATLLMCWPSFGGHLLELWYLNWLRPRLPSMRAPQVLARLVMWFVGGICLQIGMHLTAMALTSLPLLHWPRWWIGGPAFLAIELIVHLLNRLRGQPGFFDGRA